jgi:N6-L-threonylcarbamoyladenine synthase
MYVLGIETSCDETSVAIVKDGRAVLYNAVSSSLNFHKKYGGIIPEIASRMQLEKITAVTKLALQEAKINLKRIGLISVTSGPGLLGSLLTGISFAKAMSLALDIPLLGVNHVHSHIYANLLNNKLIRLPAVALVVSGGHTSLFYLKDFNNIELLSQTQDDACGEAFDKVAKILGLGYPGGPVIERLACKGNPKKIKFSCSGTRGPLDFSFSGIKTGVLYYVRAWGLGLGVEQKADIAASFQGAIIDTLVKKSLLACKLKNATRILIGGGVAVNAKLREKFLSGAKEAKIACYFPPKEFCLDNAAMVAGLGFCLFKKGLRSDLNLSADLS